MGCDIHMHVEVFTDDRWVHVEKRYNDTVAEWYPWRNYRDFSILAGVRGEESPIAEPRGIPADASPETRKDYEDWDVDAHTPSWLTSKELRSHPAASPLLVAVGHELDEVGYRLLRTFDSDLVVRAVFWFDN